MDPELKQFVHQAYEARVTAWLRHLEAHGSSATVAAAAQQQQQEQQSVEMLRRRQLAQLLLLSRQRQEEELLSRLNQHWFDGMTPAAVSSEVLRRADLQAAGVCGAEGLIPRVDGENWGNLESLLDAYRNKMDAIESRASPATQTDSSAERSKNRKRPASTGKRRASTDRPTARIKGPASAKRATVDEENDDNDVEVIEVVDGPHPNSRRKQPWDAKLPPHKQAQELVPPSEENHYSERFTPDPRRAPEAYSRRTETPVQEMQAADRYTRMPPRTHHVARRPSQEAVSVNILRPSAKDDSQGYSRTTRVTQAARGQETDGSFHSNSKAYSQRQHPPPTGPPPLRAPWTRESARAHFEPPRHVRADNPQSSRGESKSVCVGKPRDPSLGPHQGSLSRQLPSKEDRRLSHSQYQGEHRGQNPEGASSVMQMSNRAGLPINKDISRILLVATGHTVRTVPPGMQFPPKEVTLTYEQVVEVALSFANERKRKINQAVEHALAERSASKQREEDQDSRFKRTKFEKEIEDLKISHKKEMDGLKAQLEGHSMVSIESALGNGHFPLSLKMSQELEIEKLKGQLEEQSDEVVRLKQEMKISEKNQQRAMRSLMQASVHSLRSLKQERAEVIPEGEKD